MTVFCGSSTNFPARLRRFYSRVSTIRRPNAGFGSRGTGVAARRTHTTETFAVSHRSYSLRSLARSLLARPVRARPRRTGPPALTLTLTRLEDRVVPAFADVAGLRFDIPGNFNTSAVAGGTKYDTTEAIQVGLTPTGAATFVPLVTLADGGSVTDLGDATSPFTWVDRVDAVTSGAALPLLAGKADTQTVADTLPTAAAAAAHPGEGQAVPIGPLTLTPTGFRFRDASTVDLAGNLGIPDFGGISLTNVGVGKIATSPTTAGAEFSVATLEGGFQLGANSAFSVGGLSFKAGANPSLPNVGGYVRVTPGTNTVEIAGQAKFTLAGSPVDISTGQYDVADASKFVPGATFVNGTAQKFDLKVSTAVTVGGLTFTAQNLAGGYDSAASSFTLKGTAAFDLKGNSVGVTFGDQNTAGLVITNGSVTSAAFAVTSKLALGGLTFTATGLAATYDSPTSTYTIKGTAAFDLKGNAVAVNFGDQNTAGLVITSGAVKSAAFSVTSKIVLGGLTFTATALAATYDDAASTYTIKGTAAFDLKGNSVAVTFGDKTTAGLVVVNGSVTQAAFAVNATLVLGGLTFTAKDLAATYDDATSTYTLKGTATFALKTNTVAVTFGDATTAGLVITSGAVKSAAFSVTGTLALGGLTFTATGLAATYDDATSTYTIKGTASFALKTNTVAVTFGDQTTAGLVIANGTVTNAAFTVNGMLALGGLTFTATGLAATYDDASSTYTLKGTATFALKDNTVAVTFGDATTAGLVIVNGTVTQAAFAVNATLKLGGLTFTAQNLAATYDDASSTYTLKGTATFALKDNTVAVTFGDATTAGLVITNGAVKSAAFGITADLKLGGLTFTSKSLGGTYDDATSTYTVKGQASFAFKGNAVAVTFGGATSAGLVLVNGSVTSLDFTVDSTLAVGKLVFTSKDLRFTYTDATGTYTLAGNARLDFSGNFLDVTFGGNGTPGLVITNGTLTSLAVTVNSKLTVAGVELNLTGLQATYDDPSGTLTIRGKASLQVSGSTLQITLGAGDAAGVVIADGTLTKVDATVDSSFSFSSVTFSTKALRLTYDSAGPRFTVTGTASAAFKVAGKDASLEVTFGLGDAPGLVIENGKLKQLTVAVTSNFSLLGLDVAVDKLTINYVPATGEFGLFGTVRLSTAGAPGQRVLDNFTVKLGQGNFEAPGILITNGTLSKLDIQLDGSFKIAGLTVAPQKLNVRYDAAASLLRITGGLKVSLTEKLAAEATLPADQGGLTINTDTGKVNIGGFKIQVGNINIGTIKLNSLTLAFADTPAGVNVTGAGSVTLPGNLTLDAGLKIVAGKLDALTLAVTKDSPGIALFGGVFLTRISGEITGLADPANFTLKASVDLSVGPQVNFAGGKYAVATITGDLFLNAQQLKVSGLVNLLQGKVGSGQGTVTVFFTGDTLATVTVDNVQVLNTFKGNLNFTVTRAGDVTFDAGVSVRVPDAVPLVGGRELATAQLYLQIRPNQSADNSFGRVRVTFGPKPPDVSAASTSTYVSDLAEAIAPAADRTRVRSADLNGDGVPDLVTWTADGVVTVYDGATQKALFTTRPFGDGFRGDLHVTLGDLSGDGVADIVVSPAELGGARVRVYDGHDFHTVLDFFGIDDPNFRGGTYTAVGDVNGDGVNDLIVTAGAGGGPRVAGYDGKSLAAGHPKHLFNDFFAFDTAVRGGAIALIRDLDGDGFGDLILGTPGGAEVKALSGVDLMLNTLQTVTQRVGEMAAAAQAQAVQTAAGAGDPGPAVQAEFGFGSFFRSVSNAVNNAVNTVSEAAKRAADEIRQQADLAARKIKEAAEKAVDLAQRAVSFTAAVKVDFNGRVTGVAASGLGVEKRFDLQLPGTSASALGVAGGDGTAVASFFDGSAVARALDTGDTVTDETAFDENTVTPPTVSVLSAAPVPGSPAGVVTFQGTSQFPAASVVELYLADKDQTYNGRLLATVPLAAGPQSYTIPDLATYAAQPYDPAKPLYVYAVIDDGASDPVYSNETPAVQPPDYSPGLGGDAAGRTVRVLPGQALAFGPGTLGGPLVVSDPLAAAEPGAQVQMTLAADEGTLAVAPGSAAAVDNNGTGLVTLTGTADQINAALRSVSYTPLDPAFRVSDELRTTLSRFPQNDAGLITPPPITIEVVPVGVALGGPGPVTQGGGPTPVFPAAAITSEQTDILTGAVVAVGDGYEPGRDFLALPATPDIAAVFDAGTGTLTLTGDATVEQYQAALRAVTFRTTSAAAKPLTVTVSDDTGASSAATLAVPVTPGPLPPAVPAEAYTPTGGPGAPTVTIPAPDVAAAPDATPVAVAAGLTLTAPGSATLTGAVVRFADGFVPGEDQLTAPGTPAGITATYDDFAGVLSLTGTAPVADYQAALASVQYIDRTHDRTPGPRALRVTAADAAGVSDAAGVTVAVAAVPVVLTSNAVLDYSTGGATAVVDAGLTVDDRGSPIDGATVRFQGDFEPTQDVLGFTPAAGITGSYDAASGTLTLSGPATAADYQAVLRTVTYRSAVVNPTPFPRVVLFQAAAGTLRSDETGTATINVDPAVTPPALSIPPGTVTVPQQGGPTPVAPGLVITAVDPTGTTLQGASVTIDDYYDPTQDVLEYGPLPAGVTAAMNTDTGELSFTGAASLDTYQALLRSVTYRNTSPGPVNPAGGLPVTFFLDDGSGRENSATVPVTINALNLPPTATGAPLPAAVRAPLDGGRKSLGLGGLDYAPPEGFSLLAITVTAVPDVNDVGTIRTADGTTLGAGSRVTLDQLRGAYFVPSELAFPGDNGDFTFEVAGIAAGADTPNAGVLTQTLHVAIAGLTPALGGGTVFAASGAAGSVTLFNADGTPRATYSPFPGYTGALRTAVADFNGDGVDDVVVTTGPGVTPQVEVLNGATGAVLFHVTPFEASFTGGAFVAAGDLNGDGVPDVAVTPDQGGSARVRVFDGKTFAPVADFMGINDPNFRGGARPAIGDLTGDGGGDLVIAAGAGGGPGWPPTSAARSGRGRSEKCSATSTPSSRAYRTGRRWPSATSTATGSGTSWSGPAPAAAPGFRCSTARPWPAGPSPRWPTSSPATRPGGRG